MFRYLRIILCLLLVLSSRIDAMAGWDFMFSNKSYKNKVEVKVFLVSEEDISEVFNKEDKIPLKPKTCEELFGKKVYFLVNLKNNGTASAWGILVCDILGIKQKIYINQIPFKHWDTYIIPIGVFTLNREPIVPKVRFEWEKLYTK